jgi:protein-tyrosine phosphatase
MIDIHSHILPAMDDGARNLEEALEMTRQAVADGTRIMVATPHLFKHKSVGPAAINEKMIILEHLKIFKDRLKAEGVSLEILPGCDVPLSVAALSLLAEDRVLTVNDGKRYLLPELPHFSIPPSLEEICFRLLSKRSYPHHHPPRKAAAHSGEARKTGATDRLGLPGPIGRRQPDGRFRMPGCQS